MFDVSNVGKMLITCIPRSAGLKVLNLVGSLIHMNVDCMSMSCCEKLLSTGLTDCMPYIAAEIM